jgi:hypothetical protein
MQVDVYNEIVLEAFCARCRTTSCPEGALFRAVAFSLLPSGP